MMDTLTRTVLSPDISNADGAPTTDRSSLERHALSMLFARLAVRRVRYAVLRNYESLPNSVGARDIDIVVRPEDVNGAQEVVCSIAEDLDCQYANYYRDERLVQFALFRRLEGEAFFELKVDFFTNCQVYGVEVLSAAKMLESVRQHNGVAVVRDPLLFVDKWLFHLVVGQPVHAKYDAEFSRICAAHCDELVQLLTPVLGARSAGSMVSDVAIGPVSAMGVLPVGRRLRILARCLRRRGGGRLTHLAAFAFHRLRNLLSPQGLFLSVSGPDGCGKTTVIEAVTRDLNKLYGNGTVEYRHFRPAVLPRIAEVAKAAKAVRSVDVNYAQPHRGRPSGLGGSIARLAYYGADYFLGYFFRVRRSLMERRIALFDRYYFDMIGDPGRSRITLPDPVLRGFARLLPLPRLAFFIRVTPELAFGRKQELPLQTIRDLNGRYQAMADRGLLIPIDNNGAYRLAVARIVDTLVAARDADARHALQRRIAGAVRLRGSA